MQDVAGCTYPRKKLGSSQRKRVFQGGAKQRQGVRYGSGKTHGSHTVMARWACAITRQEDEGWGTRLGLTGAVQQRRWCRPSPIFVSGIFRARKRLDSMQRSIQAKGQRRSDRAGSACHRRLCQGVSWRTANQRPWHDTAWYSTQTTRTRCCERAGGGGISGTTQRGRSQGVPRTCSNRPLHGQPARRRQELVQLPIAAAVNGWDVVALLSVLCYAMLVPRRVVASAPVLGEGRGMAICGWRGRAG